MPRNQSSRARGNEASNENNRNNPVNNPVVDEPNAAPDDDFSDAYGN